MSIVAPNLSPSIQRDLRRWFGERAHAVDRGEVSAHDGLAYLAERGLLGKGISPELGGDGGHVGDMIEIIAAVAEQCMTSAFVLWSHRALIGLVAAGDNRFLHRQILPPLLKADKFGATGLADAVKYAAGLGSLRVHAVRVVAKGTDRTPAETSDLTPAERDSQPYMFHGTVPWATNLVPGRFFVAVAAQHMAMPEEEGGVGGSSVGHSGADESGADESGADTSGAGGSGAGGSADSGSGARSSADGGSGAGGSADGGSGAGGSADGSSADGDSGAGGTADGGSGAGGPFLIAVVPGDAPGVVSKGAPPLLALDGSASGSLQLQNVAVPAKWILAADGGAFLADMRPVFLLLQCGLPWGIGAAALARVQALRLAGDKTALIPRRNDLQAKFARLVTEVRRLAQQHVYNKRDFYDIVKVRKQLSEVAMGAVHLELEASGGAGYAASGDTARRLREAAFLPLQTPTLAQLELQLKALERDAGPTP